MQLAQQKRIKLPKKYQILIPYCVSDFVDDFSKKLKMNPSEAIRVLINYGILSILEGTQDLDPSLKRIDPKDALNRYHQGNKEEKTRQLERFYFKVYKAIKDCANKKEDR